MPTEYFIDAERRLVVSQGTGVFGHADFMEHMETMRPDPRFQPDFSHLVDGRRFEKFALTPAQLMDMGRHSIFAAGTRRAMVVSSLLHFGLGRMFSNFREAQRGQVTKIFRDMGEACAWLGLPRDYDPQSIGEPTRVGS